MKKNWKKYVKGLSPQKKERMLLILLEHLIEDVPDMVDYREGGPAAFSDEPPLKECIYWSGSGDDILKR